MKIANISQNEIESLIDKVVEVWQTTINSPSEINENIKYKNSYFAGGTLCIDIEFKGENEVLTLNLNNESVGFFSGGPRKLISLNDLKRIKEIKENVKTEE